MFAYSLLSFLLEQISAVSGISKGLVEAADSEEELATVELVVTVEAVEVATVEAVEVADALEGGLNQDLFLFIRLRKVRYLEAFITHTYECI